MPAPDVPAPAPSAAPLARITRIGPARDLGPPEHAVVGALALRRSPDAGRRTGNGAGPTGRAPSSRLTDTADAEISAWSRRFTQAVLEVVGGQRPVSQLVRWTSAEVYRDVDRRALLVRQARDDAARNLQPLVRSVHVCRPEPHVAEVSVHVQQGARSRALATRLERRRDRWVCTALEFG